jgi:hypothetical protein
MTETDLKNAPQYAFQNYTALAESESCGCYQCLAVMSVQDITFWTDYGKTGVCPKCGCDCLIAQTLGIPLDAASLKEIHDHWFAK